MRHLTILLAAAALAACSKAPAARDEAQATPPAAAAPTLPSEPSTGAADSIAQFLVAAAAKDFRAHPTPNPSRVRNVRLGHVRAPGGKDQYLLCGQLLPVRTTGRVQWTPFATIRTSGYEQYVGARAASFCQGPSVVWVEGDLSSALQSRLAALK